VASLHWVRAVRVDLGESELKARESPVSSGITLPGDGQERPDFRGMADRRFSWLKGMSWDGRDAPWKYRPKRWEGANAE
jgi:hypothetical protein